MRTRSLSVMVAVMAMGCSQEFGPLSCDLASPLTAKADLDGHWSYTSTIVEERDGVWVDVSTSAPLLVQARIDEHYVVFESIADPHPAQAFRIWTHGTIEPELVQTCAGPRFRETFDARPWSAHNGFSVGWFTGLVSPPSLSDRTGVNPGFLATDHPWWPQELPLRDADGQAIRWTMPSNYFIARCTDAPECFSEVLVRHEFTRVP